MKQFVNQKTTMANFDNIIGIEQMSDGMAQTYCGGMGGLGVTDFDPTSLSRDIERSEPIADLYLYDRALPEDFLDRRFFRGEIGAIEQNSTVGSTIDLTNELTEANDKTSTIAITNGTWLFLADTPNQIRNGNKPARGFVADAGVYKLDQGGGLGRFNDRISYAKRIA